MNENSLKELTRMFAALRASAEGDKPAETTYRQVEIERTQSGKIQLPQGMSYAAARTWLTKFEQDEELMLNINHRIEGFPLDVARAFYKAILESYGFVEAKPSMFQGVTMVSMPTGVDTQESVLWGPVSFPGIEGRFTIQADISEGVPAAVLVGSTRKKYIQAIEHIAQRTRELLASDSVYKGKAFRISLSFMSGDESFDPEHDAPKFIDLRDVKDSDLILSEEAQFDIATSLWNRLEQPDLVARTGVPLKHGILLEGPYGVGKTLLGRVAAKKASENNWTFIYLEQVKDLASAIRFAPLCAPAIVFAEDADLALDGERDGDLNEILNVMDGLDTKDQPIIVVLTTNRVGQFSPASLRAGRIDTIIHLDAPDRWTAPLFIRRFVGTALAPGENVDELGGKFAGLVPSFIQEAVNKARLHALYRTGSVEGQVTLDDLARAAESMRRHIALASPVPEKTITPGGQIGEMLDRLLEAPSLTSGEVQDMVGASAADTRSTVVKEALTVRAAISRLQNYVEQETDEIDAHLDRQDGKDPDEEEEEDE